MGPIDGGRIRLPAQLLHLTCRSGAKPQDMIKACIYPTVFLVFKWDGIRRLSCSTVTFRPTLAVAFIHLAPYGVPYTRLRGMT